MEELISVILPIYNVAAYLPACLDSILSQTYQNLEIILMDDGSPDEAPAICDDYARRDPRIVVLHQENQGVGAARNNGMALAHGSYIAFVDPDDLVKEDYFEVLHRDMVEQNADIVCDPAYADCIASPEEDRIDITAGGKERNDSLSNGLHYIQSHYPCSRICIFDAVAPLVYPALIDDYFQKLDEYDCVITSQKITGELGNYAYDILDRNQFYITQSPEAFRFDVLMEHFDPHFRSTELANQLPRDSARYLNFAFPENLKITYDFDLNHAESLLRYYQDQEPARFEAACNGENR